MRLVLEELTHRIGGEFAAAIRTVAKAGALAHSDEARSALTTVQCRLESFARVHDALKVPEFRTSVDGCAYLRQLCEAISFSKLPFAGVRLELHGELPIDSEQCWRLGLIVSELVSNAVQRKSENSPAPISVAAGRRGALVWCQVEDNGVPAESEAGNRGTRIVDALTHELYGAFEQHQRGDVFVATVIFPAVGAADRGVAAVRYLRGVTQPAD